MKNKMQNLAINTIKVLVTSCCNLNCKHCYQHFDKNKYSLSQAELINIVDFAMLHHTKTLDFSGGEFFVHPNAYDILDYCFLKKIRVNLATNATNIDATFFERYINTDLISIQISIDGMKENHDLRRGRGTWDKAISAARKLSSYGIPLTANMAMFTDNYTDAVDILSLPYFSNFSFTPVAYSGASTFYSPSELDEDYEQVLCQVMREFECKRTVFSETIFPNILTIKYDGNVYMSPVAGDYELFCLGNIKDTILEDLCNDFYKSATFSFMSNISADRIDECKSCSVNDICDGGCRFRAYKFFGDLLKPDPFYCRIYLDKYNDIPLGKLFWGEK